MMKTSATILMLLMVFFAARTMAIEEPAYTVMAEFDEVEYRQYAAYLVAETLVTENSDRNEAANIGFRRLFKYISGDNVTATSMAAGTQMQGRASESIAMTAPVRQRSDATGWSIAFIVPAEYTRQSVPQPTNPLITIQAIPPQLMAVHRYSGRWTDENFAEHQAILLEHLKQNDIQPQGKVVGASYNPPFMPPFLRRNEVMVRVDKTPQH